MQFKRVTMQDIADACGLSRNTVSKVFNGRGSVPPATAELVLRKSRELGYGSPSGEAPAAQSGGNIALLTCRLPGDFHFGTAFLPSFTDQISRSGYSLKIYEISPEELREKRFPPHFIPDQIAGIVGIELFDSDYLDMICGLGIPTVLTDSPPDAVFSLMQCDYVTMESVAGIFALVGRLAAAGAERIGFVGDYRHCGSFRERWSAFRLGLEARGLRPDDRVCICDPDTSPYSDPEWLMSRIEQMPYLPDAFVCANDFLAIHLMMALKRKGYAVPADVMITGFDGTTQSAFTDPPLTTVQIYGADIGRIAADVLLIRIRNRSLPYTWTRVKTAPVWRESIRPAAAGPE